jgi:hypothetical protein
MVPEIIPGAIHRMTGSELQDLIFSCTHSQKATAQGKLKQGCTKLAKIDQRISCIIWKFNPPLCDAVCHSVPKG